MKETENFLVVKKQNWFYDFVTFILTNGYIIIHFRKIHDGIDSKAPVLLVANRKLLELSNQDLPATVYTSQSEAVIRFTKKPTSNLKLKIQKVKRSFCFVFN
jgi:preprotein translocase subunit SecF